MNIFQNTFNILTASKYDFFLSEYWRNIGKQKIEQYFGVPIETLS